MALKPKELEFILETIAEGVEEAQIPLLFFRDKDGKTPLDIAVEGNQILSIGIIIEKIIHFYNNPIFNYIIDKNLITLFRLNVDLSSYFESNLPLFEVYYSEFKHMHSNDELVVQSYNGSLRSL